MNGRVLLIDDERNIRRSLGMILTGEGFEIREAASAEEGLAQVAERDFELVFLDMQLPGMDGMEALRRLRESHPALPVIMISGHATVAKAVEATQLGAWDFMEKPFARERVLLLSRNATRQYRLSQENLRLRGGEELLGECPAMEELRASITQVATTDARVLILGESGTGKELVARALHRQSSRSNRPFVRVNCAAIPEELIESELFGVVKGAYTGADQAREGRFAAADGGTILLDEIGDMSLRAQVKVLRVLQEGEFEAVGSTSTRKVDVRVLAATHQNLAEKVERGEFREDLLYRLNVIPLEVLPLRERGEDIALLAKVFLEEFAARHEKPIPMVDPAVAKLLGAYRWPGNIRELRNLVERLLILSDGSIGLADLPVEIRGGHQMHTQGTTANPYTALPLKQAREQLERDLIGKALDESGGNITQAAKTLGLERTNLHKRIRALGLDR